MKVVSISNLKGGVGKTTLSVVLARYVASRRKKVLLIDADPQGTASLLVPEHFLDRHNMPAIGILDIVKEYIEKRLTPELVASNLCQIAEGFYMMPNCVNSMRYDYELITRGYHPYFFRLLLKNLPVEFDLVIFDCPPYFSSYTLSAWCASKYMLIPAEASVQAIPSVELVFHLIQQYSSATDISFRSILVIPVKVRRTKVSKMTHSELREAFKEFVTEGYIPFTEYMNKLFAGEAALSSLAGKNSHAEVIKKTLDEITRTLEV